MWNDPILELKKTVSASRVLSSLQKKDINEHLTHLILIFDNTPDTITAEETEVIFGHMKTVIEESTKEDRSSAKASKARREFLRAVHDKEDQANLLSEKLYEFCQILGSLGV